MILHHARHFHALVFVQRMLDMPCTVVPLS
jgi:hypothetical protein